MEEKTESSQSWKTEPIILSRDLGGLEEGGSCAFMLRRQTLGQGRAGLWGASGGRLLEASGCLKTGGQAEGWGQGARKLDVPPCPRALEGPW